MSIHPPRNDESSGSANAWQDTFFAMLRDWMRKDNIHGRGLHFPDYSCCYPQLRAGAADQAAFFTAVRDVDIRKIDAFRVKFMDAYLRVKDGTDKDT